MYFVVGGPRWVGWNDWMVVCCFSEHSILLKVLQSNAVKGADLIILCPLQSISPTHIKWYSLTDTQPLKVAFNLLMNQLEAITVHITYFTEPHIPKCSTSYMQRLRPLSRIHRGDINKIFKNVLCLYVIYFKGWVGLYIFEITQMYKSFCKGEGVVGQQHVSHCPQGRIHGGYYSLIQIHKTI